MAVTMRGLVWMGVCLLVCGLARVAPAAADDHAVLGSVCGAVDGRLPASVHLGDDAMLPHVQAMLRRSVHFRQQCLALAARPWVYVRLRVAAADELGIQFCAKSDLRRTSAGPLIASVRVGCRTQWSEWIPHELEHVLEAAEGMRTADFAHGRGTWESTDHAYETARAILAGRAVREQTRRRPPVPSD